MSRYRPPTRSGTSYITPEGKQMLKQELHRLWQVERPAITRSVADAAALGDRSENAEYLYGKKRLREIDRRVHYLSKRLQELTVVHRPPDDTGRIFFGAYVTLADDGGHEMRYRLVGPDEIDPQRGHISIDSPLGKALLGKPLDAVVSIRLAAGQHRYVVVAIRYDGWRAVP